jgi:cytochrome P450
VVAFPVIHDFDDASYNPFTALKDDGGEGKVKDFFPELKRMREANPVFEGDFRRHFGTAPDITLEGVRDLCILGAKAIQHVCTDPTYSVAAYKPNLGVYFGAESITTMDNPEHARYRRYFQQVFGPGQIKRWGTQIVPPLINRLVDNFIDRGRADLVTEFALLFPFHFIHELMRLPLADRDIFHRLAFGQLVITFDQQHGMEACDKLRAYLSEVVKSRRENPIEGDFISMIATAEIDGEQMPLDHAITFFRQIMNAGGDTSYHGFSTLMMALLTHPEQFEAVRKDRSLVPKAIEEALRWDSPVTMISRTPTRTVELAGVTINPGDHMQIILPSANRDPAVFDRPDEFDISRGNRQHGAFGYGPHICIGQHLARLEMSYALNTLLDRLPKLRLDESKPAPYVAGLILRGPAHVHVRFD